MFYILIISFVLISSIFMANQDAYFTKYKNDSKKYSIQLQNESFINTNNDTCYLGKTSNFTFLYIKSIKESWMLKNEIIKSIKVQKK